MKLSRTNPAALKPHPRNYNQHDAAQVEALAESLTRFEQTGKAVVTWRGFILSGHGLVLAAQRVGLAQIETQDVSDWPEAQALAWMVADNELAKQSTADEGALADLLGQLQRENALVGTGFDEAAVDELLAKVAGDKEAQTKTEPVRPKKMARVLVSFPVDTALDAKPLIDQLQALAGVEVDYGAN